MKTLQVFENNALKAYQEADEKGKSILSNLFGKEIFSRNIKDLVKTFEDACEIVGVDAKQFFAICENNGDSKDEIAYKKIKIIAKALNEGWIPNWSDRSQAKYYPWFEYSSSGLGFSYYDYVYWHSDTTVGSRLCYKSSELAIYAGKQFQKEYNEFLNL